MLRPRVNAEAQVILDCDTYQASVLNNKLPKGFKLEQQELVYKALTLRQVQLKNQKAKPNKTETAKSC